MTALPKPPIAMPSSTVATSSASRAEFEHGLFVERLDGMEMHDRDVMPSFARSSAAARQLVVITPVAISTIERRARARAHRDGLADGKAVFLAADDRIAALGEPDVDRVRPIERAVHQPHHFLGVANRRHRHVRQRPHDGDVFDRQMRRAERGVDQSAAVADQPHRQIMQAEIDRHLLVAAPRDEGRDGVDVGDVAFHRQARRHADARWPR